MNQPTMVLAANVTGDLMSVDIDNVEVGDIMFMGGHLVRRVWTKPSLRTHRKDSIESFRMWQGLKLDEPTDGSVARGNFQTPVGQACLVLRKQKVTYQADLCQNCFIVAANDDWSGVGEDDPRPLHLIPRADRVVIVGEVTFFSNQDCQGCGALPGVRLAAVVYQDDKN